MKLHPLPLSGAFLMELDPNHDQRGYFCRLFEKEKMQFHNLETNFPEWSAAYNIKKGTLRGLHYQKAPYEEIKLVHCVKGSVFDTIVDIRPNSPTFKKHYSLILNEKHPTILYIPKGFAHGYQTLNDDVLLHYYISAPFKPESSGGILFNDPELNIQWPLKTEIINSRDLSFPTIKESKLHY